MSVSSDRAALWAKLLASSRLQRRMPSFSVAERTEFDRDYDRIIFGAPFRRLQGKTQVFPLSPSDYTRTRLTHSLEVASVGRSLGVMAGMHLQDKQLLPVDVAPGDVGIVIAAACLAHDLGNPPFGHSGEDAIQEWAKQKIQEKSLLQDFSPAEKRDFVNFEGNAQSFRILCKVEGRERIGGLQLTHAVLATLLKYPRPSWIENQPLSLELTYNKDVAFKKFNYFQDEAHVQDEQGEIINLFQEVCQTTGMIARDETQGVYARHPLAFLMEAADDVCYAIVDLEDAYRVGLLSFDEMFDLLHPLFKDDAREVGDEFEKVTQIVVARSFAIDSLTQACFQVWRDNLEAIENGTFTSSLIEKSSLSEVYSKLKQTAKSRVYTDERVLLVEYAGYQTIGGLLEFFYSSIVARGGAPRDKKLRQILPNSCFRFGKAMCHSPEDYLQALTPYQRLLCVTDYISGLTDRNAVDLYQKLSGIKLPN